MLRDSVQGRKNRPTRAGGAGFGTAGRRPPTGCPARRSLIPGQRASIFPLFPTDPATLRNPVTSDPDSRCLGL